MPAVPAPVPAPVPDPAPVPVLRRRGVVVVLLLVLGTLVPGLEPVPAGAALEQAAARAGGPCVRDVSDVSSDAYETCEDPGEAHLSSRAAGTRLMTPEQYVALLRLEDQANAAVRAVHGMSDTPQSHDRVVAFAAAELRAALVTRLLQVAQSSSRTADEQAVAVWLSQLAQDHSRAVAQQAQFEFFRWSQRQQGDDRTGPCAYQPPAPYEAEWPGSQGYEEECFLPGDSGGVILNPLPLFNDPPRQPSFEQFVRWGAAEADYPALLERLVLPTTSLTGLSALALGAGSATVDAAGPAAVTRVLAAPGVSGAWRRLAEAGRDVPNDDVRTQPGASQRVGPWADQLPPRLREEHARAVLDVAGRAAFTGYDEVRGDTRARLQGYVDATQAGAPSLQRIGGDTSAAQLLFSDLVRALPDTCTSGDFLDLTGGLCPGPGSPAAPQRTPAEPLLRSTDGGIARGTSVPFAPGRVGASYAEATSGLVLDRRLTLADGWFVLDGTSTPLLELSHYVDNQRLAEVRYEVAGGRPVLRTVLREQRFLRDTDYGPCAETGSACTTSRAIPFLSGRANRTAELSLVDNAPPALPVLQPSTQTVEVGQLVTLSASPASDPDGDAVVSEAWTAEFDYPCAQSLPAAVDWQCGTGPRGGNGPGGGYVLPTGTRVVWNTPGTWQIALTRTDQHGASSTRRQSVQVVAPARNGFGVGCDAGCVTSTGEVVLRGYVEAGPTRDAESVTIDWGDGTVTRDVPSSIFVRGEVASDRTGPRALPSGTVVTPVSSVAQDFVARHAYGALPPGGRQVTVVFEDAGQGGRTQAFTVTRPATTAPAVTGVAPGAASEGAPTTLTAVVADASPADAGTAVVAWGDGTTSTVPYAAPAAGGGLSATHTYADDGSYAVTVTPTDAGGATGPAATATQTVAAAAPALQEVAVAAVATGTSSTVTGRVVDPGAGDAGVLTVDWGDGSPLTVAAYGPRSGPTAGAFSLAHAYGAAGSYAVTVTASDEDDLASAPATATAVVTRVVPRVASAAAPAVVEGTTTALTATVEGGGAGALGVDWGDGSPVEPVPYAGPGTVTATHAYADDGGYDVRLVPTSSAGTTGEEVVVRAVVTGAAPVASGTAVTASVEGSAATLSTTVGDAGGADAGTLRVDWGDGSPQQVLAYAAGGGALTATHAYVDDDGGPFLVTVVPTDDDGLAGAAATASAVVDNAAPTLVGALRDPYGRALATGTASAAEPVVVGVPATLSGSFADAGRRDTRRVRVVWGDGTTTTQTVTTTGSIAHAWSRPGTYVLTATVTDDDGGSASRSVTVTVQSQVEATRSVAAQLRAAAGAPGTSTPTQRSLSRAAGRLDGGSAGGPSAVAELESGRPATAAEELAEASADVQYAQGSTPRADVTLAHRQLVLVLRSVATTVVAQQGAAGRAALADGHAAVSRGDLTTAVRRYLEVVRAR